MSDDTRSGDSNANSGKGARISETFNERRDALAEQVAQLSPEAQEKCRMIRDLSDQRLETEKRNQQRSHQFRVYKQQVTLLENYIKDQSERPPEIRADPTPDLDIILRQAERMVKEREEFYVRHIEREADANIRQIVVGERQGQGFRRNEPQHDHEQDY